MDLTNGDWIALSGTVLTVIVIGIALWQLKDSHNTALRQMKSSSETASKQMEASNQYAKVQNWLLLRNVLTHYDDIHANFRPDGAWYRSTLKPDNVSDWARVELYMGVFEFIDELIDNDTFDSEHMKYWYIYRLRNIVQNPRVVKYKLQDNADGWLHFLKLCSRFGVTFTCPTEKLPPFISVGQ
jgi:hypothetical protein